MEFERISVIGLGYIGLPTAAMFASRKLEVIGVDVNEKAVETISRGEIHIIEPDLDMVVQAAVKEGYLRATTIPEPADAFLIAVPTPFRGDNHKPDLSYIEAAATSIAPLLSPGNLVILESTSPVGATESMAKWLAAARPDLSFPQQCGENSDIRIAHCPERVLPGQVMQELITNDRVIGGMTSKCSQYAKTLYQVFVTGECVIASNPSVAEMTKLTENSFRDVNIAFANELSMICDKIGVDVWELIELANRHPRVSILQPGPGVGGHCIAVDPWFLVDSAPHESRLIATGRKVNLEKEAWVLEKIRTALERLAVQENAQAHDLCVAIYGLTFKANIDDIRESPALAIVQKLSAIHQGPISIVEPNIDELPGSLVRAATLTSVEAARTCDLHVVLVDHDKFGQMQHPQSAVLDFRGIWRNRKTNKDISREC